MSIVDVASTEISQNAESAVSTVDWQVYGTAARLQIITLEQRIAQLEAELSEKSILCNELNQQIDALKYQLVWMAQQIFGKKSEASKTDSDLANKADDESSNDVPADDEQQDDTTTDANQKKGRGKQKGAKGYGRRLRTDLPFEEIFHDIDDDDKFCPQCGLPFEALPFTEDSELIHWEVKLVRHIHRRCCYTPTCTCQAVPGIVTAPPVDKLIPKGMFTEGFWVRLILEKFLFQRPLYRIRQVLVLEGFDVSQGTLTGGLNKIKDLVEPLYKGIIQQSRQANHWQMDETRWMVFEEIAGKTGYRWWLWVVVTKDTVVYLLDPTRSSKVPKEHLGPHAKGILSVDRYSAYKALSELILLAFCWAHQRRDFIRIHDGYRSTRDWANAWIERIDELFHINAQRCAAIKDPAVFDLHQQQLNTAVEKMAETWQKELLDDTLRPWQTSALKSMKNHWSGLTIFVDNPHVPMDNNESERRLRNPVIGRKNYYGCGSVWSGSLCAMLFTILQTCCINRIDPQRLLLAYFQACAENRGRVPQDPSAFLPWNLTEEKRQAWKLNDGFP
ncbi:transposase [Desulfosarcina ovata subsp. sediminis]|uniref:Transposase n=1 Tax=Desulfosarcina ovata subsp. sediminis TaxID=885957 RepID=A0A5K7ZIL9_9BACT|nr:IS66 family transposase [Desulfosarcina ovata]BBO81244.1 transposase [Desulfosarcina ovata subsp. sediminis]